MAFCRLEEKLFGGLSRRPLTFTNWSLLRDNQVDGSKGRNPYLGGIIGWILCARESVVVARE
jgi:hypothetical protein